MSDQEVTTKLNIARGDTSGVKALDEASRITAQAVKNTEGWDKALVRSQSRFKSSADLARVQFEKVRLQTAKLETEIKAYGEEAERAFRKQEDAAKRAARATQQASGGGFGRDAAGDLSTSLGAFASVGGALGGGVGSELTALGGDVFGAVENIGRAKDAISALGNAAAQNSSLLGSAAGALGSLGSGLLTLGVAGAAAAAAAVAFGELNKSIEAGRATAELYADANRKVALEIAQGLTSDDAQAQIDALKARIEGEQAAIQANQQYLDDATQRLNDQLGGFLGSVANTVSGADDAIFSKIDESKKSIREASAEITRLEAALKDGRIAANDTGKAEIELSDERKRIRDALSVLAQQERELQSAFTERQRVQEEDIALQLRYKDALEALENSFDARRQALDDQFAAEDAARAELEREDAFQARLAQVEADGNARILDLRTQLAERTADAEKRIGELRTNYLNDAQKAQATFDREAIRRAREYNDRRQQLEQDFQDAALEGLLANDVSAILRARRDRDRGLDDTNTDERQANEDARQQFEIEQVERQQAFESRVAQIRAELTEFTSAQQAKIAQEQANIAARLKAEQDAFTESEALRVEQDERQRQREQAYADLEAELSEKRKALTLQQDAETRAIREGRELAALNAQLAKIDAKKNAELAALDAVIARARSITTMGGTSTNSTSGGVYYDPTKYGMTGSQGYGFRAFAEGGIVSHPTLGLVGEKGTEVIAPLSDLDKYMRGGRPVTVNMADAFRGAAFGDAITQSDLDLLAGAVEDTLTTALVKLMKETE